MVKVNILSKYDQLWQFIADSGQETLVIPFDQVKAVTGVALDPSFLQSKKELLTYGYQVDHIFLKKQQIKVSRIHDE